MKKEELLGRTVSILYRLGQSHIGKQLGPYNIGAGQFSFLAELLHRDGISQDAVAFNLRRDKGTAARAIQNLEKHGFLERKQDEEDKRVKKVFVTSKAREFSPILFSILKDWSGILFKGLNSEEKQLLLSLLNRSVENVMQAKLDEANKPQNLL